MMRWMCMLLAALFCVTAEAEAHVRSQSQSRWSIDGNRISAHIEASAVDVTRLYALGAQSPLEVVFKDEIAQAFAVSARGQRCLPNGEPRTNLAPGGRVTAEWSFDCPDLALASGDVEIESRLFLRVAPTHLHFIALSDVRGRTAEAVLTEAHPRAALSLSPAPASQSAAEAVLHFIPVGAEHVWSGLDHMAFILALVLFTAGRWRDLIFAASGFTLGHSSTLGLAALGAIRPNTIAIEALIGFTVAFIALEIGEGGQRRMQALSAPIAAALMVAGAASLAGWTPMSPLIWFGLAAFVYAYPRGFPRGVALLALMFGLIHGCGFAGALAELDLPKPRLLAALLGFNLGVEVGQLAVIAAALTAGIALRYTPANYARLGTPIAGAALFALGVFWFVSRLV